MCQGQMHWGLCSTPTVSCHSKEGNKWKAKQKSQQITNMNPKDISELQYGLVNYLALPKSFGAYSEVQKKKPFEPFWATTVHFKNFLSDSWRVRNTVPWTGKNHLSVVIGNLFPVCPVHPDGGMIDYLEAWCSPQPLGLKYHHLCETWVLRVNIWYSVSLSFKNIWSLSRNVKTCLLKKSHI